MVNVKKTLVLQQINTQFVNYKWLIFIAGLMALSPGDLYTQTVSIFDEVEATSGNEGKVRIIQDENIEKLVEKNQWQNSKIKGIIGYRIRIFSDSGPYAKKEFEYTKAKFSENFGNIKIHQEFDYPFYKIYVGDFRNRSQALKILRQIERKFPDAFIVQTRINYPNLKTE